jgi:hypothetical protein
MSSMNWDRVRAEDRGRRNGYEQIESIPPTPPKKKKSKPMKSKPPKKQNQNHSSAKSKNECKVVQVEQISGYLGCNHSMLVTSLQHLARDSAAVEVLPGQWVRIHCMQAPPSNTKVEPMCPECNSDMVTKVGVHGPFLSCARFPACKGKRRMK